MNDERILLFTNVKAFVILDTTRETIIARSEDASIMLLPSGLHRPVIARFVFGISLLPMSYTPIV
jgi:hypothetical protein